MLIRRPVLFPVAMNGISLVNLPPGALGSASLSGGAPFGAPRRIVDDAGDLIRETQVTAGDLVRQTQADAGDLPRTTVEAAGTLPRETDVSAGNLTRETTIDAGNLNAGEEV